MAYLSPYHRPSVYTGPSPRIVCPHYSAMGKENCLNCHFHGVALMKEICDYLNFMVKREKNNKKIDYLKGLFEDESTHPNFNAGIGESEA
jgi:hypothetical protein